MIRYNILLTAIALAAAATDARAQTLRDCDDAIASLRAQMATAGETLRAAAQAPIRNAERERDDGDLAACLGFVDEGRRALAGERFEPHVTGHLHLELQNDYTYRRRGGRTTNDLLSDSEFAFGVHLLPFFTIGGLLHSEPQRERPDGDRFLTDNGVWMEELYAQFNWSRAGIRVGKFNPQFGRAWNEHIAPGIYGKNFAEENYKLTEALGFNPYVRADAGPAGRLTLSASVFKFDNTLLSQSAFVDPRIDEDRTERVGRNRVRFGGPGNTGYPTSFAFAVDGEDVLGIAGLNWNIGVQRLARGRVEGDTSQYGAVSGLTYAGPLNADWDLRAVAEVAYLRHFEGVRHNNLVPSVGVEFAYDKSWLFYANYSQARRQGESTFTNPIQVEDEEGNLIDDVEQTDIRETALDRIYSVGVGYQFDFGLRLDLAWVRQTSDRDAPLRDTVRDGVGFRVRYEAEF